MQWIKAILIPVQPRFEFHQASNPMICRPRADTSRTFGDRWIRKLPLAPNLYRSADTHTSDRRGFRHWNSMSEMNAAGAGHQNASLGDEIVGRINELAAISETPEHLARIFLTKEHRAAADLILSWRDEAGISMREALTKFGLDPAHIGAAARARSELLAYIELHIEQGPVLEAQNLPVGVVTAIAGATRLAASLNGMAGHAGTVPMALRRDALAGAARWLTPVAEVFNNHESGPARAR